MRNKIPIRLAVGLFLIALISLVTPMAWLDYPFKQDFQSFYINVFSGAASSITLIFGIGAVAAICVFLSPGLYLSKCWHKDPGRLMQQGRAIILSISHSTPWRSAVTFFGMVCFYMHVDPGRLVIVK